eukprot:scaffold3656_cov254-Pinguiococcus_pyrenoidosus.AAC.3
MHWASTACRTSQSHAILLHLLRITHHGSRITDHASRITHHGSGITHHGSRIRDHLLPSSSPHVEHLHPWILGSDAEIPTLKSYTMSRNERPVLAAATAMSSRDVQT